MRFCLWCATDNKQIDPRLMSLQTSKRLQNILNWYLTHNCYIFISSQDLPTPPQEAIENINPLPLPPLEVR